MVRVWEKSARLQVGFAVALLLAGSFVAPVGAATTYNVSSVSDLLSALVNVNAGLGGDTIVLAPGVYAITAPLDVDQDVTIQGDPVSPTVIEGTGLFTILDVRADNISVQNLMIRNGTTGIAYEGSGVFSGTGVTITGTTDTAFYPGDSGGTTFFTNSTIANNTGNGIEISCADLRLINVTISGNAVGVSFGFPCGNRMEITNSLIVGNVNDCGGGGSFVPVGTASFDSDGSCVGFGFGPGLTTQPASAVGLGSLADNGGPTWTRAISAASVAVDAGANPDCPATDQRGFLRNDGACDIGAYEAGATAGGGNTPTGSNVSVSPAPGVTVTFSQVDAGGDTTATTGGPLPPSGFQVDGLVYDISTTAMFTGSAVVCLPYSPTINPNPSIYHFEDVPPPAWVNRTTLVDKVEHIVCGTVTSLSPFAVLVPISVSAQLQDLQVAINSFNLRKPAAERFNHRIDKLRGLWVSQHKHAERRFCAELAKFVKTVGKESGKTLSPEEANELLTRAASIAGAADCRGHHDHDD